MRITKRQLRRIIKEEKSRIVSESQTAGPPIGGDHAIALGGSYGGPDLGNYDSVSSADELPAEPHSWAEAMDGDVERDEEGQHIIYLSKELHPDVNSFEHDLPQDWDYEETYDEESWVIYTNQYPDGQDASHGNFLESKKITAPQLKRIIKEEKQRLVREMNPDGTISDNEDDEREDLLRHVEMELNGLIDYVISEASRIGGDFRSPGIKKQAFSLMADMIHSYKR